MIPRQTINTLIKDSEKHRCPEKKFGGVCVKIVAVANLPTRFGNFQIVAFYNDQDKKEHTAIVKGNICAGKDIPTRIHSECLTGDAFGSLRCDCRDQLEISLKTIGKLKQGILLYLRQEGRGIGLTNKIKAYALQDMGHDTFEADKILGFSGDERDYNVAAHMLYSLKVSSIKLMTNNPKKMEDLISHSVKVTGRIPLVVGANAYNRAYLETKRVKGGHLIEQEEEIIVKK